MNTYASTHPPTPDAAGIPHGTAHRPASTRLRAAATALLVGGPLSLVFHALWRVGHGPTIVNEHGVVLGLTNDQWSYLGALWIAPVAFGVLVVCGLWTGPLAKLAAALIGSGLVLGALSAWMWPLYSLGALLQYAGLASLAVLLLRGHKLARWPAGVLVAACVGFGVTVAIAPTVLDPLSDLTAAATASAWTSLGLAVRGFYARDATEPQRAAIRQPSR